jgi:chromosome segregation ATPase
MESNKTKPILGLSLAILSIAFFLVSLGGLIGVWVFNQSLTDRLQTSIENTSTDLEIAADAIELSKTELISTQAQIDLLQAILETLGLNAAEDLNRLADIVGTVEDTLMPVIDNVANGISTLSEALHDIIDTIERFNELPLVNIEIPGMEIVDEGANQLENLQTQIEEGGGKIEQLSQTTQDTIDSLTTGFSELETSVSALIDTLETYEIKIQDAQAQLDYLGTNLPIWIDIASIILTLLLIWLGFSQVGLFILGWSFYKGEDLLSRWRVPNDTNS